VKILIRDTLLNGEPRSILIEGGRIVAIDDSTDRTGSAGPGGDPIRVDRVLDAGGLHAFPSLRNSHTHVAMVLFRGYGDDMPLMEWLQTRIWPAEGRLDADDVYDGARLGILEMIRTGTTFFNEMYWHREALVRAVEDMGVRAMLGANLLDLGDPAMIEAQKAEILDLVPGGEGSGRARLALAPHSVYTVAPKELEWVAGLAREHDLRVHIHLSETQGEVERCLEEHGCRPAVHLERLGLVGPHLIAAHGQYLDESELELLAEGGATVVTNPLANLKLATGGIFPYAAARRAGLRVCLGTDGASSNNSLDMFEEIKMVALLQKHREADATVLPAPEALELATVVPAELFGQGSGRLEVGEPADLMLVDLSGPGTQPVHDPVSALVYAASGSCVRTTICDGQVLMHDGKVEICDEEEVIAKAVEVARRVTAA
jgi:5-methylthioadenosine/S-adenosylhomocysteine deaminase